MKKLLFLFVLCVTILGLTAAPTFDTSLSGTKTGLNDLGEGFMPLSVSWTKKRDFRLIEDEKYNKARLQFSFSSSLSNDRDYGYDKATGVPSWKESINDPEKNHYSSYFNPTGMISSSLSQKFEHWTVSGTLNTRYSHPMESLLLYSSDSFNKPYFSDGGVMRFSDKKSIAAYPWLYGERQNFTLNLSFSLSRSYEVKGLNSMNVSFGVELGPWWLLNFVSNDIRLSDYFRISASASESVTLKNDQQTIKLRWLVVTASHSNNFSYTFGKVVPKEKLGSYRLRGTLSDSFSISVQGPQLLDSSTAISGSFTFNNSFHFGTVENATTTIWGYSFDSYFSLSGTLNLFGIMNFSLSGTKHLVQGLGSNYGWSTSGEVSMSFNF